jgi:hypothetical protein
MQIGADENAKVFRLIRGWRGFEIVDALKDMVRAATTLRGDPREFLGRILIQHRTTKTSGQVVTLGLGRHFGIDRDATKLGLLEVGLGHLALDLFEVGGVADEEVGPG